MWEYFFRETQTLFSGGCCRTHKILHMERDRVDNINLRHPKIGNDDAAAAVRVNTKRTGEKARVIKMCMETSLWPRGRNNKNVYYFTFNPDGYIKHVPARWDSYILFYACMCLRIYDGC